MKGKPVYSSAFRISQPGRMTTEQAKAKQEWAVGEVLVEAYQSEAGSPVTNLRQPRKDPPDLLWDCRERTIGAELFQLEAFTSGRALLNAFVNSAYRKFEEEAPGDRYLGVGISLDCLVDVGFVDRVKSRWAASGIRGNQIDRAAGELVRLVTKEVSSVRDLTNTDFGLPLPLDSQAFPALAALTSHVVCIRCRPEDLRRSDGRAAPLIIPSSGSDFSDEELIDAAAAKMTKKVSRKAKPGSESVWHSTDHAVLVAHDLPRNEFYEGVALAWEPLLIEAGERAKVLDQYDELWLVTCGNLKGTASRLCGSEPS